MKAGLLRNFLTIQRYTETGDAVGQPIRTYVKYADVWASVQPMTGRETFTEQRVSTEQTHRINMRYIEGIESTMRIIWGSRVFEIIGNPINYMERNTYLTFNVKETFDHETVHPTS